MFRCSATTPNKCHSSKFGGFCVDLKWNKLRLLLRASDPDLFFLIFEIICRSSISGCNWHLEVLNYTLLELILGVGWCRDSRLRETEGPTHTRAPVHTRAPTWGRRNVPAAAPAHLHNEAGRVCRSTNNITTAAIKAHFTPPPRAGPHAQPFVTISRLSIKSNLCPQQSAAPEWFHRRSTLFGRSLGHRTELNREENCWGSSSKCRNVFRLRSGQRSRGDPSDRSRPAATGVATFRVGSS